MWWPILLILTFSLVLQLRDVFCGLPDFNNMPEMSFLAPGEKPYKCFGVKIRGRRGICETNQDCLRKGGYIDGACSYGKHCCIIFVDCKKNGPKVTLNDTYIGSKRPPLTSFDIFECWSVIQIPKNIKQIRLDFIKFYLAEPNKTTGVCQTDILFISGGTPDMGICGIFTGQHLYLDVKGDITINYSHGSAKSSRFWEINIIHVDSTQQAPTGCLQYFQESAGSFTTFNYISNGILVTSLYYYKVCIRLEKDMCSLGFEFCNQDDEENNFKAIANFHERNIPKETYQFLVPFVSGGENKIPESNSSMCVSFLQKKRCH